MILQTLSKSLKEQNWTAIWIEFFLLVAGVFLGIRAANWNEQRTIDRQAKVFTERLREDLRVEAWRFAALNSYYEDVVVNAKATMDALEGRAELSSEGIYSAYRVAFRMLIPSEVQVALASSCGDRLSRVNDYESIKNALNYPCKSGLPQQAMRALSKGKP